MQRIIKQIWHCSWSKMAGLFIVISCSCMWNHALWDVDVHAFLVKDLGTRLMWNHLWDVDLLF